GVIERTVRRGLDDDRVIDGAESLRGQPDMIETERSELGAVLIPLVEVDDVLVVVRVPLLNFVVRSNGRTVLGRQSARRDHGGAVEGADASAASDHQAAATAAAVSGSAAAVGVRAAVAEEAAASAGVSLDVVTARRTAGLGDDVVSEQAAASSGASVAAVNPA